MLLKKNTGNKPEGPDPLGKSPVQAVLKWMGMVEEALCEWKVPSGPSPEL